MNPVPFNPGVPENPSDELAISQPQLMNNFLQLYNYFLKNHLPIDAASGAGNHTIIELLEQSNSKQTDVSEISVYTKDVESTGITDQTDQIFIRYQGNGQEFQYTNYQIYSIQPTPSQTSYFTFLPGRILIYFGTFQNLPNNILSLFPPVATNIISVSTCPSGSATLKARADPIEPSGGFITGLLMRIGLGFFNQPAPNSFYLIMANI
jgi:hypothetical protein